MTNVLKKTSIVGLVVATVAALSLAFTPATANAQTSSGSTGIINAQSGSAFGGSLRDLIILEELFDGGLSGSNESTYTVRPGDTLSQIAAMFDTSVGAIVRENNISNPNLIYVGERLVIPDQDGGDTNNTLRDLVVIGGLFGSGAAVEDGTTSGSSAFGGSLRDLIILEELFNGNNGSSLFNGNGDDNDSVLRDLILLEGLFGSGNGGSFFR